MCTDLIYTSNIVKQKLPFSPLPFSQKRWEKTLQNRNSGLIKKPKECNKRVKNEGGMEMEL